MSFNFDTTHTSVSKALRIWRFPVCRYSEILSQLFFGAFVVSLFFTGAYFSLQRLGIESLFSSIPSSTALKLPVGLLALALLFWEVSLFMKMSVTKTKVKASLFDALLKQEDYNLAEFLSMTSCGVVEYAIKVAKQKRFPEISSEVLFYALLMKSKDVQTLVFRLGLDVKKLQNDVKNTLEKMPRQKKFTRVFSKTFQKTLEEAAEISNERGLKEIGEKEILVALAGNDPFFKDLLVQQDLKPKDIENITLWLEAMEITLEGDRKFWTKENLSRNGSLGRDFASGFTVTLDKYSMDWTRHMSRTLFNEIVGHKKEITELETVLAKSSLSNALLVGEEGIGRKSIVEGLAQRCYLGTSLAELNGKRLVELDMIALLSAITDSEKLELILDRIFNEVISAGNVILVINDLVKFVGKGSHVLGAADISGILGKYLALPHFQFIGIVSFEGVRVLQDENPALLEYFREIEVKEVTEIETIRILQNLALRMEQEHQMLIIYPSVREIVNLMSRYSPNVPFPKKAIDVLDEVVSYVGGLKEKVVLPHHVAKVISDKTHIPVGKMEFREKSVLLNLENLIHERIVNQKEAVQEISIAMRRARAGLENNHRPMGSFLFLGPTGVGKTETAKALAHIYFGGEENMIRLDMSEFQSLADIGRLIGTVSPVEQQGLLTNPVREKPFSLVLIDELEKAHPDILNLFLQVLDEGHITDGHGRRVMFTNTIIICTSNAGASSVFEAVEKGQAIQKDELLASLFEQGIFKPEFVNRFDASVIFHPLTKENLLDIAQLLLNKLVEGLKEKDVELVVTDSLKEKLVELSYKPEFGAREMRRVLQDTIENSIAKALLADQVQKGDSIEVNSENFEVIKLSK